MINYPKVKLSVNPSRDVKNGVNFLKFHRRGKSKKFLRMFYPTEVLSVIKSSRSAKERDQYIKAYARRVHRERAREIRKGVADARANWKKVATRYFRLVDRIFKNHPWPKGRYEGFATVFWMFPRNVSEKTFFFPFAHKLPRYANKVIAHELLHFIFFDYVKKKYGLDQYSHISSKPHDYIWKISEAFNTFMENWKPYRKIFGYGGCPYWGTERIMKQMAAQWEQWQDVDKLLDKWLGKYHKS